MKHIETIMGGILIVSIISLNVLLLTTCFRNNTCIIFDKFSWGFTTGMVLVLGLSMLGGTKK